MHIENQGKLFPLIFISLNRQIFQHVHILQLYTSSYNKSKKACKSKYHHKIMKQLLSSCRHVTHPNQTIKTLFSYHYYLEAQEILT